MNRILVTGGSGLLGRQVVERLKGYYLVRVMSRHARPDSLAPEVEWARADLETGADLHDAVAEAHTIIHCASSPLRHTRQTDVDGTRRLLERAEIARVKHLIYISIVGIDRVPSYAYYRHKLAAESLITHGRVPWSVLRTTQFHDLIDYILRALLRWPSALVPGDFQFQPVDSGEVADALARAVMAGPKGRLLDMGGPEVLRLGAMAHAWSAARRAHTLILPLRMPGQTARSFRRGELTCPENRQGRVTWGQWLRQHYASSNHAPSGYAQRLRA
jgi:uncharacterized protein YbjT (DUF2867 family)